MSTINYQDFEKIDMRVGCITAVEEFPEAKKPAYKLTINFGLEIGQKKSSAQITDLYSKDQLLGRFVVCVTNFPPKQIGPFVSECLTCGVADPQGRVALLGFNEKNIPLGSKIF